MKKFLSIILTITIICGITLAPSKAQAADYTEETVQWGSTYSGEVNSDTYDLYKLVVPAKMTINIRGIDIKIGTDSASVNIYIYDDNFTEVGFVRVSNGGTGSIELSEGTYYFKIERYGNTAYNNDVYKIAFYTAITKPTVKLSSNNSASLTVKATRDDNTVGGYEVRYRLSKKSWTTKTIECIDDLNTTFKGLSKGKYYSVQVRKYVESENGTFYYSKWSDIQKIKIKK